MFDVESINPNPKPGMLLAHMPVPVLTDTASDGGTYSKASRNHCKTEGTSHLRHARAALYLQYTCTRLSHQPDALLGQGRSGGSPRSAAGPYAGRG